MPVRGGNNKGSGGGGGGEGEGDGEGGSNSGFDARNNNGKKTVTNKLATTPLSAARKPPPPAELPVATPEPEPIHEPEPILEKIFNDDMEENNAEQVEGEEKYDIVFDDENPDYEATYEEENADYGEEVHEGDSYYHTEYEGGEGGILTGLKYDPLLPPLNDDPREGKQIQKGSRGKYPELFDPRSTLVRPDMRVIIGPTTDVYGSVLKHDDVVIVPDFFCHKDDWSLYYKLIEEMREAHANGGRNAEWVSWHEGAHLVARNPHGSPTFQDIQSKISHYFNIPMQSVGTRFNWYRNSTDWKPFHHDSAAYNHQRAQNQNISVGVSFGSTRELAFLNVKNGTKIYFPQTNGMLFSFGRDVNIQWKHGINALPEAEQDGRGRVSIVLWGTVHDVIEEDNSPPVMQNGDHSVAIPRDRRRQSQPQNHSNHTMKAQVQAPPPPLPPATIRPAVQVRDNRDLRGPDQPLFILSEDRERMEREKERERESERVREREREREWERQRERREEWERQRVSYGRSRSRSRERRVNPPPHFDRDRDRGLDRGRSRDRDRDYLPPPPLPPPPASPYTQPPRDYPREDRGGRYQTQSSAPPPSAAPTRLPPGVCFDYVISGVCRFGENCKFRHV